MVDFLDKITGTASQQGQALSATTFNSPGGLYVMADTQTLGHRQLQWSQGASLVIPIVVQPPPRETWQLTYYAVTMQLALTHWQDLESAVGPVFYPVAESYGKLGKIVTGLWTKASISTANASNNAQEPMLPLPPDGTLLSTIFDPATDDLPPGNFFQASPQAIYSQALMGSYSTSQNLAQPVDCAKDSPISLICTMFPTLAQNAELRIMSLNYVVGYQSDYSGMAP